MAMRVQYFRYSIKLMSPSSHLEHHSFLSVHREMIYSELWAVKNAYTSIKCFSVFGRFSVWGFMRRGYVSRSVHADIVKPPGTHVFVMDGRCTGFPVAPCSVLCDLAETVITQRSEDRSGVPFLYWCFLNIWKEKSKAMWLLTLCKNNVRTYQQ